MIPACDGLAKLMQHITAKIMINVIGDIFLIIFILLWKQI
ncbi:Uncharacterized protein dnm_062520 [Desulfonema magnum]|uniref:Uncharacterized protein n=1 Tax=Desulfonema magnum TaxID=45655 RepID=A0A975GQM3_9BACT|nr:Uncharacterized protein dnm_062520 [Desulfonema magnum]